jgi:hypothetical protein
VGEERWVVATQSLSDIQMENDRLPGNDPMTHLS